MKPAKSIGSLVGSNSNNNNSNYQIQTPVNANFRHPPESTGATIAANNSLGGPTSPICRCRVMYLGSSVPHITKDGLQGIQEPLRELYPDKASLASGNAGIDSWLSVWSNGILVENVDDSGREVKRFFKIEALHYCAAVKYVPQASIGHQINPYATLPSADIPKFLPLDSPHARLQANSNPPIFASILRRTTGIKVLECHAFICKREAAANALVRCCFHAYADTMYAKQIGADVDRISSEINNNSKNSIDTRSNLNHQQHPNEILKTNGFAQPPTATRRSKSIAALNEANLRNKDAWTPSESSDYNNGTDNQELEYQSNNPNSMIRRKSINSHYSRVDGDNMSNNSFVRHHQQQIAQSNTNQLQKQNKLSKSMHHLNRGHEQLDSNGEFDQASGLWPPHQQVPAAPQNQPFYNPHASRVPTYPPQSLIDAANGGGTLKSIKSVAATSIASTLLRSKKHAKAMSMAQLNQDRVTSFHQPHSNGSTLGGPLMMPPVPSMFLPNSHRPIINGSQTMKVPSRSMMPLPGPPINFEAMTPKEMKKLLKKSAKYGIDPSKFSDNGLPLLPFRPPHMQPPQACHILPSSRSGTMISQSAYSMDIHGSEMSDLASIHGLPMQRGPHLPPDQMDSQAMKPILVKPNPEFLKSKAGKKWLKQQKEFKKLLPPHLDGLPIVFGPPPIEALEPAIPNQSMPPPPPPFIPPPFGMPVMDSSGYYNPHPFYGPSGRASAASTLLRYSPHSQMLHDSHNGYVGVQSEYMQPGQPIYGHSMGPAPMVQHPSDFMGADGSSMVFGAGDDRRFTANSHHHHHHPSQQQLKRNLMVEQSVISLGDENDYDDEECNNNDKQSGYYNDSALHSGQTKISRPGSYSEHNNNNNHSNSSYSQNGHSQEYEQVGQMADDQSSYSSGIYRRGHMNERAFSHSIVQEHRNGNCLTNPSADYVAPSERSQDTRHQHRNHSDGSHHQMRSGDIYQNTRDSGILYHEAHQNESHTIPVNELTARLENQLNMKSFSNSKIKSHI